MIDVSELVKGSSWGAREIDEACRTAGFFRVKGHGVPLELWKRLDELSRLFFKQSEDEKGKIALNKSGRGWFPLEGELTSG